MRWSLPTLALRRPITTVMVVVTLLGLGVIAHRHLPLEYMPSVDFPYIGCWIPYPGATPAQVEKEIAVPTEGELLTVPRTKTIRSSSFDDGCWVFMQFDWQADMAQATAEVRDRLERLKLRLPEQVDRLWLRRWGPEQWSILVFAMFRGEDPDEIMWLARERLAPRLERTDGVAGVEVRGPDSPMVYVEFDQNRLRSLNLGLYETVSSLSAGNLSLSVGDLEDGGTKYFVRTEGEFTDLDSIRNLVIGPNSVRVKDVATVSMRRPPEDWQFALDGQRGAFVLVKKESRANTVATCDALRAVLDDMAQDREFQGIQILVFEDFSKYIRTTISGLARAGRYGALLALAVLFVFLRRVRATILVALAIPASLTGAFIYMYFMEISLNIVTMSGMILCIGMLVDNSIVVIENIHRHYDMDPDPALSAGRGASEVGLAITAATLTTIIVFIPMLYMEMGEMALYLLDFAYPVSVAMLTSLALALTVIPLAASRIYRHGRDHRSLLRRLGPARAERSPWTWLGAFRPFERFRNGYVWLLGLAVQRRIAALLLLAGLALATYLVPFPKVGMQQMPTMDLRRVVIQVDFEDYSKERAERTFEQLAAGVNELRDALSIEEVYVSYGPWGGRLEVHLQDLDAIPPGAKPPFSTEDARFILSEKFPERLPGTELHFGIPRAGVQDTQQISLSVRGADAAVTAEYAQRLESLLDTLPDVVEARTDHEVDKREIEIRLDDPLASGIGVDATVLARTVGFALQGRRLDYLKRGGREIPVWAQFQESDRCTKDDLDMVAVVGRDGQLVPLEQLVTTQKGYTPPSLRREQGKSVCRVNVEVSNKDVSKMRAQIEKLAKVLELPRGYSVDMGVVLNELEESQSNFKDALGLAIILMYLLMAALFESILLPLSILTTVPLAFIGVYWMMYATGTPLDMVALIAGLLMCGVVVNNGIVIVDHINQLRRRHGLPRREAILQAGRDRLRPVLMTALTTVLGCVPIAIGMKTGQDVLFSAGRTLVGGLSMGTVLTLIVVPLAYSLVDDLQCWVGRYAAGLAGLLRLPIATASVDQQ